MPLAPQHHAGTSAAGFSSTGLINCFPGDPSLPVCHVKHLGCLHGMVLLDTGGILPSMVMLEALWETIRKSGPHIKRGKRLGGETWTCSFSLPLPFPSFLHRPCSVPGGGQCPGQCVLELSKMQQRTSLRPELCRSSHFRYFHPGYK